MQRTFAAFALPPNPEDRPVGIRIHKPGKPDNLLVATFSIEADLPEAMSMLAADLVHNTRVALDHTLARLKEHFGGTPGQGSFPICKTSDDWRERVTDGGRRSPLHGLDRSAVNFIGDQQPMHTADPENDPLVVLNGLDNDDKHRLMHVSFVYPGESTGLDLVEIPDPQRIARSVNRWTAGRPLEHGTPIATFFTQGPAAPGMVRAGEDARVGFAIGDPEAGRTQFTAMIDRVRGIVDGAVALIDRHPPAQP